jgi:hypothetical protein
MADIDFISLMYEEIILPAHLEVMARAAGNTGVIDGNRITPDSPASMDINIDSGRIRVDAVAINVSSAVLSISAAHATLSRIDLIYRNESGVATIYEGTASAIDDLGGVGNWHQYALPTIKDNIPSGVILGAVYIPATCTELTEDHIWMFAAETIDLDNLIVTSIGNPGLDTVVPSEKATRTNLDLKINTADIVTTVGSPGSDSKVPSEQGTREALDLKISTADIVTTVGSPGSDTKVPSEQGVREALDGLTKNSSIGIQIGDGLSVISTGVAGRVHLPRAMTLSGWELVAKESGSIGITVSYATYANYPTVTSFLTVSVSSAQKGQGSDTTALSAGVWLIFNVTSCTTITQATLALKGSA